jgi:biopolymer transport protein ExbD
MNLLTNKPKIMANELDSPRKVSNTKTKKLSSIIDFSALVSLSFLLIMFYMLTSAMSRPQEMKMSLPSKCDDCGYLWGCGNGNERTITVLLDSNNNVIYYQGLLDFPISYPKSTNYGKLGIRKELLFRKQQIDEYSSSIGKPNSNNMIIIIKPSKQSNYKNLVDILDEIAIIGVETYAIVNNFTPEENKLLSSNQILSN